VTVQDEQGRRAVIAAVYKNNLSVRDLGSGERVGKIRE